MKSTKLTILAALLMCLLSFTSVSAMDNEKGHIVVDIKTTLGDIKVLLYDVTPKHRDNFAKLVNEGFYDGVLFHRVINDFMIQTGDPTSKDAAPGQMLGGGDPSYLIDAEIVVPELFHKRGALAAARMGDNVNPERKSSGSQFYIVTGSKFTPAQLDRMEQRLQEEKLQDHFNQLANRHREAIIAMRQSGDNDGLKQLENELIAQTEAWGAEHPFKFTPEQREAYTEVGGAPHLDGTYTVFGEVISGMDTVEKIEKVRTDGNDRPIDDVRVISMKIVKQ